MDPQVLLAHPGTQYSYQLARQLARYNSLFQFWTGFSLSKEEWYTRLLQSYLPNLLYKKFANRVIEGIPANRLRTTPWLDMNALRQLHAGQPSEAVHHKRNKVFQERITQQSIQQSSAVIGFDTSSWLLAERARKAKKVFLLDQSIAHPMIKESVLQTVAANFPRWQEDIGTRSSTVYDCEQKEYALATRIVVASTFTRQTLVTNGICQDKIIINPYGVDLHKFCPPMANPQVRPLRFLFLGAISARKGIPLLLQAWEYLQPQQAELWLVGPMNPSLETLITDLPGLVVKGKYPHSDLPALLHECDVLVFPSYFEGFGLVLLEALASGLPIITTEATAGPDLIKDGKEGFIIPSGNLKELCQAMQFFIDNPERLSSMSRASRRCAEQYSWDAYGDRWQEILKEAIVC